MITSISTAKMLFIDKETRSDVDLKLEGIVRYVHSARTDSLCMAYAFDNEDVLLWILGDPLPKRIKEYVKDGGTVVAHNASFEWYMWNYVGVKKYGWPVLPFTQMNCTMARAYAMSLPGKLEKMAAALGLSFQKDMKGHRVMMQLCKPKDDGSWWADTDKYEILYKYCMTDVEVEREAHYLLKELNPFEQKVQLLDRKINGQGICVDVDAAEKAKLICDYEIERLNAQMRKLTNNYVPTCNAVSTIKKWLALQGLEVEGVAKDVVTRVLADPEVPQHCKEVLRTRQEAGKSSIAKIKTLLTKTYGGKLHELFQYHGGHTGRWGGRGFQAHNLPRPDLNQYEIEDIFNLLTA